MATLPTNRTTANTRDQHVSDHDELHRLHNILDGSSQPSTGGGGGGAVSIGGAGKTVLGGELDTLDSDGNPRNVLDDGTGRITATGDNTGITVTSVNGHQNATLGINHGSELAGLGLAGGPTGHSEVVLIADDSGGKVKTTDADGADRNVLDDGSGNAIVAGQLEAGTCLVDGLAHLGAVATHGSTLLGHGSEVESTDSSGDTRNRLDDGNGNASISGVLTSPSMGVTIGAASLSDNLVHLDYSTPWGIDTETNVPYYDSAGATSGEEAILLPDLTLIQVGK